MARCSTQRNSISSPVSSVSSSCPRFADLFARAPGDNAGQQQLNPIANPRVEDLNRASRYAHAARPDRIAPCGQQHPGAFARTRTPGPCPRISRIQSNSIGIPAIPVQGNPNDDLVGKGFTYQKQRGLCISGPYCSLCPVSDQQGQLSGQPKFEPHKAQQGGKLFRFKSNRALRWAQCLRGTREQKRSGAAVGAHRPRSQPAMAVKAPMGTRLHANRAPRPLPQSRANVAKSLSQHRCQTCACTR